VNYVGYQLATSNKGPWCWNSISGCGPQLTGLKYIGVAILIIFFVSLLIFLLDKIQKP